MRWKYWLLTGALLGAFFTPPPVRSADFDELQAIFDQALKALNTGNVDAWIALMDDGVVYFPHNLPFPIVGKDDNKKMWQAMFDENEKVTFVPIDPQFHITGSTGVAWGYYVLVTQQTETIDAIFSRYTVTYAKTDGQWRIVVVHTGIPPGSDAGGLAPEF
jgi:ketosteroid isomerase-like protein